MNSQQEFFEYAAQVGLTKHIGGIKATEMLIELCQINKNKQILDVGCGAGVTPVYLAETLGCRVVGIDNSEGMVKRSIERVKKERLTDKIEIRKADAQDLPFEDHCFDAVISESVTAFTEDKQKAVHEYVRVTKPGGFIGLNESTWLKVPPPPELITWASQDLGTHVHPLTSGEWVGLLEAAGLKEIFTKIYDVKLKEEAKGIYRRYGFRGMLGIMFRMLSLYSRNSAYRRFVKKVRKGGIAPKNLNEYFGYGIYVGKK